MTLALIAGSGALPALIAKAHPTAQIHALADSDTPLEAQRFRVETLGTLLHSLKTTGVTQVCFAGAVTRPRIDPAQIDAATRPLVPQLMAAVQTRGDDATLRAVLDLFDQQGFAIRAAHELVPDLLPPQGVLAGALTPEIERDAARAADVLRLIAPADIGQSCIVANGQVQAVEAAPGTDHMLAHAPGGGVVYKAPKAGQDRRIDLPTIGPDTIAAAAQQSALVIEAGGVMMLDRPACVRAANAHGLTLWVRPCASS